jgi:excisionase family DNA binding protein
VNQLAYSIDEARAASKLGRNFIYSAIASKQLKVIRIGRKILIPHEELERFLRELTDESSAAAR